MDWERTSYPLSHIPHGDEFVPGAWPENDFAANFRKRKSSFDEPAAKRQSPPRATKMSNFLASLGSYSPFRFAKKMLLKSDETENPPLPLDAASSNTRQSRPNPDTISKPLSRPARADVEVSTRSSDSRLGTKSLSQSMDHLGTSPLPSQLSMSLASPSPLSTSGILRPEKTSRSSRYQQRDRQKAFARAALMSIRQPKSSQPQAPSQYGDDNSTTMKDNRYGARNYAQPKAQDNRELPVAQSQKILLSTMHDLAPILVQRSCDTPFSPSAPFRSRSELEDNCSSNQDLGSDAGTPDVDQAWILPKKSIKMVKNGHNLENIAPTSHLASNNNKDSKTLPLVTQRPLSPPPLCSRPTPAPRAQNEVSTSHDLDTSKESAELAQQIADRSTKLGVSDSDVTLNSQGGLDMSEIAHAFGETKPMPPPSNAIGRSSVGLDDCQPNAEGTNGSVVEPDISKLQIADTGSAIKDIPKATSHSDEKLQRITRAQLRKKKLEEEALNQYEIVALPAAWEAKVRQAVQQGHGSYAASDLARAVPEYAGRGQDNWLNDEVINGYLNLVTSHGKQNDRPNQTPSFHAFNSFFYTNLSQKGPESVMRWSKRPKINGSNLLNVQAVFIPINTGLHWTLAVVEPGKKRIIHYNSMRSTALGVSACKHIRQWVAAELGKDFHEEDWVLVAAGESPQQSNSDDCGVFTVTSARQIMLGFTPMSYRPDQMRVQRKRIVAELVNGALIKSRENLTA